MDKNSITGLVLIFLILVVWSIWMKPSEAEMERIKQKQDSIEQLQRIGTGDIVDAQEMGMDTMPSQTSALPDSLVSVQNQSRYGGFANHAAGDEQLVTLENDKVRIVFSNLGGRIISAELKEYKKLIKTEEGEELKTPLLLLEDEKNKFEYWLPYSQVPGSQINTGDLFFNTQQSNNAVTFRIQSTDGSYFEQNYELNEGDYLVDYSIAFQGLDNKASHIPLHWTNYLDQIEINTDFEKYYSTLYFKEISDDVDYCNCRRDAEEELGGKSLKWISGSNQFFNTTLIAGDRFDGASLQTEMLETENTDDLKKLTAEVHVPFTGSPGGERINMQMYIGPNDFENLREMDLSMEDIIPFGRSIFGTINRWVIRPIFSFLSGFVGNKGIVILILTFLVKLALYPLMYKMLHSQTKMAALKPEIADMKEKYKDDQQKAQMETMKMYREYGVNPLGGCLPMVAQMPIWFALYRFFPASIEFRQSSFLWATDLSSYDVFFHLPFNIPFYGDHVSLFTLLWAGATLIYTYYNSKLTDMNSINPMMKYMQYFMPIMFLFFFNNYASGLTIYLFFSTILNIGQTLGTKNLVFNEEKIREELYANKEKPKKKSKFQSRLEEALKEQQKQQAIKQKNKGKK